MNRDLDILTLLLLDPCLTTDEAAREAEARTYTAALVREERTAPNARSRKRRQPAEPTAEGPPVGF